LTAAAACGATVRAEFTAGSQIPDFSLPTPDGKTLELGREAGTLRLTRNGASTSPRVLAIHLLQPDCLQCRAQLRALQSLHERFGEQGLAIIGVSHRGDDKALAELAKELGLGFPVAVGAGSTLAKEFAAGDSLALVDSGGMVRFAQVGYGVGDEKLWIEGIESMLAGKLPAKTGVDRERLAVGDPFPAVVLPSLGSGKTMELTGKGETLVFRDDAGKEARPKAAVGFFSRY